MKTQNLFNTLLDVCGYTATESDMIEIINAIEKDIIEQEDEEERDFLRSFEFPLFPENQQLNIGTVSGSFMCALGKENHCKEQCFTCSEDEKCDNDNIEK